MGSSFTHLHVHTEFSMLDGASRVEDLVAAAVADGQPAVGITDHGNMYGALPMYTAAREAGVKPILGMEGYFTNTSRFDRPKRAEHEIFHLTMHIDLLLERFERRRRELLESPVGRA